MRKALQRLKIKNVNRPSTRLLSGSRLIPLFVGLVLVLPFKNVAAKPHPQELQSLTRLKAINLSRLEALRSSCGDCEIQLAEYELRREFFDRLTLKLDLALRSTHTPSAQWLAQLVESMATTEAKNPQMNEKLWKFLNQLTLALKQLPAESPAGIEFIEGYLNFSSISRPKSHKEFESRLSYSNGLEFAEARGMEKDRVGDVVEKQLKPELSQLLPQYQTPLTSMKETLGAQP